MRVKFLADADFDHRIIRGVRRRESQVDFQSAGEADLQSKSDFEVLQIAANLQRLLVTHDRRTMPSAFGAFAARQRSFGVLIVRRAFF
jgi:predicted nuclease of predicted toxin-antitoxin system